MSIFEEESAEDRAFWENPTGPPAAPAGVDPDDFQAPQAEVPATDAPDEGAEEAPAEEPPAEEGGQEDPPDDGAGTESGDEEPAPVSEPKGQEPSGKEVEELAARVAAYEKRLADKDEFINRQANELGQLRQRTQAIENQSQMSDWDEILYDNPAQAAQLALNAGDKRRYMAAREAWEEVAPGAAAVFEQNINLRRDLDELKQQVYNSTEPLYQERELQQVASAYAQVKEKYPNFDEFEGTMGEILNTRPLMKESLQSVLRSGSAEDQESALEDLYLLAAGRKRDTLSEAARGAKATLDATAQAQRQAATVVTGGASPEESAQTIADRIGAEWDEIQSPYDKGWEV